MASIAMLSNHTGWAPKIAKLVYKWLNSMVYGRYNYSIHGDYFMVYKPT